MSKNGNILVNTALGRKKPRNIERKPHVALSWVDPENGYHSASIQGRVVDTLHGRRGGGRHRLARAEVPGPVAVSVAVKPGEQRVSFVVEPTHVYHQDYS